MISAMNAPLITYASDFVYSWVHQVACYRLMTLPSPVMMITFCIRTGTLLRKVVPIGL
jgi:hypothetical protein